MEHLTSRQNSKIQHIKKLGTSRSYRYECKEFMCDGWKMLEEAIKNKADITNILFCDELLYQPDSKCSIYKVDRQMIEYVSPLSSPQNVLFTCRMKEETENCCQYRRRLVLDGIQDPGNVGTMIRTANAFYYDLVVLLPGCADIYNPKTTRATMGAIFRQRIAQMDYGYLDTLIKENVKIYGAALSDDSCDIRSINFDNFALCIGSEGKGLSDTVISKCTDKIIIPMRPDCESLNAAQAAGIIMWESVRHRN